MKRYLPLALLGLSLALAACSSISTDTVDYKSAGKNKTKPLDVPPDLTQLTRDSRYAVPGEVVSASGMQAAPANAAVGVAPASAGNVSLAGEGLRRWLVVKQPAEPLWDTVKDFWLEHGFVLAMDESAVGVMETDWAENRAKLPHDFIRSTIGRVFDALYDTGERDKFRTRIDRVSADVTEIYISHRGMVEVYDDEQKNRTIWQPRPNDPELEVEFLRRLMLRLGLTPEQVRSKLDIAQLRAAARVETRDGQPVIQLDEEFDRAWRRVGLALDRTGFTVEDRDRRQGLYFVRYVAPATEDKEAGFFSRLFSSTPAPRAPVKYRIQLSAQGTGTVLSVLDAQGQPEKSEDAQRIVKVLAQDLK